MDSIDLMIREHDNILRFTVVVKRACCSILEGGTVNTDDFKAMLTFARTYADKHHHGKEERTLFREMSARLGSVADSLIRHGMLVEHDMGRFHIAEMEAALDRFVNSDAPMDKFDLLANASAWADLLRRHIARENDAVYAFARRKLPPEILRSIDGEMTAFESNTQEQEAMLFLLDELETKYTEGS